MGIHSDRTDSGVGVVSIDLPPVNALPVAAWHDLATQLISLGSEPETKVIVLRAEGRGFCAGVDIKELQAATTHEAMVGVNRGCFAAFKAVYETPVPVIAAVQGFCLGGGIGLIGNADGIIAADDATFGLPEIDRGALGAATHLSRMLPQHLMRMLFYTGRALGVEEFAKHGAIWRVTDREGLDEAAMETAEEIAAKDPYLVRFAKEALNGIDPVDVNRSYRYEQSFTFEANLLGRASEAHDRFVDDASEPER